jgi:tetratricopeptide (TPR) repeat protein
VRSWVRAGFVVPGRGSRGAYRFSFQDLVVLRAAKGLADARVPPRRIHRALERLRRQLPRGRGLAAARIAVEGSRVVVRQDDAVWEAESGQRLLDFEVAELSRAAAPLAYRAVGRAERGGELTAAEWFELGCEIEATAPDEAIEAYYRALEKDPELVDGHLNLGRLLHEAGQVGEAERHYRRAVELRPEDATAAYNLGVALQDLGRLRQAVAAYSQAVAADPGYADAYFNLAGLYERLGNQAVAIKNLKIYKSLMKELD